MVMGTDIALSIRLDCERERVREIEWYEGKMLLWEECFEKQKQTNVGCVNYKYTIAKPIEITKGSFLGWKYNV